MALTMCLHSGGHRATLDQIKALPDPIPKSPTHTPIRHDELITLTRDTLGKFGFDVQDEMHALSRNNAHYFGLFELKNGTEQASIVGIRNADDLAFRATMAGGNHIFVCDNLMFNGGEITIARKHTKNILRDLPRLIEKTVMNVTANIKVLKAKYDVYKSTEIDDPTADYLIMQEFRRGIINVQRIGKIVAEWDEPSYPEFAESKNVWRLFNATTTVLRPETAGQLHELPGKTAGLHQLMDAACDLNLS